MTAAPTAAGAPRLTRRGAATRARIVGAAADIVYAKGVAQTSLDEILEASGTSKSQLYHYFADKDALIREVVLEQTRRIVAGQELELRRLDSVRRLRRWGAVIVEGTRLLGATGGCPLGSLASELADQSEDTRALLEHCFEVWMRYLVEGLEAMRDRGELQRAAPDDLAVAIMAALQGGLLLAQTMRSVRPLEIALDMAMSHVEAQVVAQ